MKIPVSISAEALERKFDEGNEDILQYFDITTLEQPNKELIAERLGVISAPPAV
jgi:hypothetical protein